MNAMQPQSDVAGAAEPRIGGREAEDAALAELFEYAGMRAEVAVQPWRDGRRKMKLGLDAYGGACVMMPVADRRLLNALKRTGAVRKGT